ncbi:MAG: TetR family transcriptional regulator [Actinomycetota bacterium]
MATRAENRRRKLLALSDAAVDLFDTVGPHVTVDAIAERAGISRRTVFRHVDSKEELAFIHPLLWFDAFDEAVSAAAGQPLDRRLWLGSQAIAAEIDADPDRPRRAFTVAVGHPELQRGFQALFQRWTDRITALVDEVQEERGRSPDPFRSRIIGSAVMGMVDAVTRAWLVADDGASYADLCHRGFDVVAPLIGDAQELNR